MDAGSSRVHYRVKIELMEKYRIVCVKFLLDFIPKGDWSWRLFECSTELHRPDIAPENVINVRLHLGNNYVVYPNVQVYCLENYIYLARTENDVMLVNNTWDNVTVIKTESTQSFFTLLLQLFYTHAVRRQMVQLHCATIEDQGRGVLFLGPSGIGKTTQAERWAEFRGASIINGDVGFVQRTEREYIAWGTPWHGSSPYCLNASVPVKALVVLKQAPENRLRELTGFEKVSEIAGSVFYPTWLENGMELCTDTLNHLLTDLPVYRLDNRADRESVEILAKELDRIS